MAVGPPAIATTAARAGQPVLWALLALALWAVFGGAFVSVAPNRLLSGTGTSLLALLHGGRWALCLPLALLLGAACLPPSRGVHALVAMASTAALAGLLWLAGDEARRQAAQGTELLRTSLGGGFWVLAALAWLAAADALQRLALPAAARALAQAAVLLPLPWLLASGQLDALSLMKEYTNRADVFEAAALRHLQIVAATLLPALLIGLPLGVAAARHPRLARPLFAALNLVQTVPSIALFALLIAPLGWLGEALPGLGIRGIGLWPAAVALTLYALLPVVHGMTAGLQQVPAAVIEAATGMGLTARQRFWQVALPLASPVVLSALRVTTVQVIGLAVVAALVGAGGFGALVFQGLASSAIDLVLLGVLPVVALALAADAALRLAATALERAAP